MIQRKQTIFLILAILLIVAYIFTPVVKVLVGAGDNYLYVTNLIFSKNVNFPVIGPYFVLWPLDAAIAAGALLGVTIFLYRRRPLQIALCWVSVLPLLFSFCYVYYHWSVAPTTFDQYFYFGNLLPLLSIVFIFTAMFYIRKDEELVKSVDRLR